MTAANPCHTAVQPPYWSHEASPPSTPSSRPSQNRRRGCATTPAASAAGEFRAPRSRIELDHYFWFCIDHVRAYNAAWNYYAGMSEGDIEQEIRRDTVWHRPSWKLGERHGPAYETRMRDPFGLYGVNGEAGKAAGEQRRTRPTARRPRVPPRPRAGPGGVRHRPAVHPTCASNHGIRCW